MVEMVDAVVCRVEMMGEQRPRVVWWRRAFSSHARNAARVKRA